MQNLALKLQLDRKVQKHTYYRTNFVALINHLALTLPTLGFPQYIPSFYHLFQLFHDFWP